MAFYLLAFKNSGNREYVMDSGYYLLLVFGKFFGKFTALRHYLLSIFHQNFGKFIDICILFAEVIVVFLF
jgi:hypothetical protein